MASACECFRFSLNGKAPPLDSLVLVALESYASWLATGAPVGSSLLDAGYPKPIRRRHSRRIIDAARRSIRTAARFVTAQGQGLRIASRYVFLSVSGAVLQLGAGMQELNQAAAFIAANMPLGLGGSLTMQEAWDVAMFINAHERPQDPRYTGSIARHPRPLPRLALVSL